MVELGLLQDAVGSKDDLMDVPLRSWWEGIRFVNQALMGLSSVTLPLLKTKSNKKNLTAEVFLVNNVS